MTKTFTIEFNFAATSNWFTVSSYCKFYRESEGSSSTNFDCASTTPTFRFLITNTEDGIEYVEADTFIFSIYVDVAASLSSIDNFFGLSIYV